MKVRILICSDETGHYADLIDRDFIIDSPVRFNKGDMLIGVTDIDDSIEYGNLTVNECYFYNSDYGIMQSVHCTIKN